MLIISHWYPGAEIPRPKNPAPVTHPYFVVPFEASHCVKSLVCVAFAMTFNWTASLEPVRVRGAETDVAVMVGLETSPKFERAVATSPEGLAIGVALKNPNLSKAAPILRPVVVLLEVINPPSFNVNVPVLPIEDTSVVPSD